MTLFLKNTHAEHEKQFLLLEQIRADMAKRPEVSISEKHCSVNDYFTVATPNNPDYDEYLEHYLVLMSRNLDRANRSYCYVDMRH